MHGFDIPLDDTESFSQAASLAQEGLRDFGLHLSTVRTNFREMPGQNWEHAHGAGLATVLSLISNIGDITLIGSSYTYRSPHTGWGSSPELDHLLSNGFVEIRHDGADHTRHEKIKFLLQYPEISSKLRVCFQENSNGANCGRCEKCWRTRFSFAIEGIEFPECFPAIPLNEVKIGTLSHTSELFWQELKEAAVREEEPQLVGLIQRAVRRARVRKILKTSMKALLRRMHLPPCWVDTRQLGTLPGKR